MATRNISSDIKTAFNNRDPLTSYHLIKFEKPSNLPFEATNANHYVYLTDAPYSVVYDGNEYVPGSTVKVGKVPETIEAKATNMTLQLSAVKLNKQIARVAVTTSTLGGTGTASINAGQTGTLTVDVDFFKSGFYPGDEVVFTRESPQSGYQNSFRVRLDKFYSNGTKIDVTNLTINESTNLATAINGVTNLSYSVRYENPEITALTNSQSALSFDNYINRSVTIYRVFANPKDGTRIGDPVLLFKGIISKGTLQEKASGNATITWSLASHWGDFVRVQGRLTSDESHRALDAFGASTDAVLRPEYKDDRGFEHAETAVNVTAQYTDIETRGKSVRRGGLAGWFGGKKYKEEKFEVTRDLDLSVN